MPRKSVTQEQYVVSIGYDVDYETETYRNCQASGCDSICRCEMILSATPTTVNLPSVIVHTKHNKTNRKKKYTPTEIEEYCIERLCVLNQALNLDLYNVTWSSGYYGQEVDGVFFDLDSELREKIWRMLGLSSDIDKVEFVLEEEYAFCADLIKDAGSVTISDIDFKDVGNKLNNQLIKKNESSYLYQLYDDSIIGVVCKNPNVDLVLVDGHHRLMDRIVNGSTTGRFIVLTHKDIVL